MATIIIPNFLTAKELLGLNTYQYTALTAAMHVASIRVDRRQSSAFTITINQNGSPVSSITVQPLSDQTVAQSSQSLSATMNCAVNDVITVVVSSSSTSDMGLKDCKAILDIHIGSNN